MSTTEFLPKSGDSRTRDLLAGAKDGKAKAWDRLYERYSTWLINNVKTWYPHLAYLHQDIEDCVNESFVKAHDKISAHEFQNELEFRKWLRTIVLNSFRDHVASLERRHATILDTGALDRAADRDRRAVSEQPGAELEHREEVEKMHACMARLDDDESMAVIMKDREGLTFEEMSEILGIGRHQASDLYKRAWRHLNRLEREQG